MLKSTSLCWGLLCAAEFMHCLDSAEWNLVNFCLKSKKLKVYLELTWDKSRILNLLCNLWVAWAALRWLSDQYLLWCCLSVCTFLTAIQLCVQSGQQMLLVERIGVVSQEHIGSRNTSSFNMGKRAVNRMEHSRRKWTSWLYIRNCHGKLNSVPASAIWCQANIPYKLSFLQELFVFPFLDTLCELGSSFVELWAYVTATKIHENSTVKVGKQAACTECNINLCFERWGKRKMVNDPSLCWVSCVTELGVQKKTWLFLHCHNIQRGWN